MVEMNALFKHRASLTVRTFILVIFSISLMMADHRWKHLDNVRNSLSNLIYPLQYTINIPVRFILWIDDSLTSHSNLLKENAKLKEDQLLLEVRLQKLDVLESENQRLRKLLGTPRKLSERVLIAEIFAVDLDPYKQLIVINKDANDGAYIGQAVVDAQGIMGQIIHVDAHTSTVMLLSDPNHAIPVQLNRNGLRATAFGTGSPNSLELRFVPQNADIQVGDKIISSGLGGRFPPNYPVGTISKVERPAGERFASIEVTPAAYLDRSREVLMVWHNAPPDNDENKPVKQ